MSNNKQQLEYYKKLTLHRVLITRTGFFQQYLKALETHNTKKAAFNYTNDLYAEIFGEPRFADYDTFRNSFKNHQ